MAAAATTPSSSRATSGILSSTLFAALDLTDKVQRAISAMGHTHLTHVQAAAIPPLMQGRDVLGAARTGARSAAPCSVIAVVLDSRALSSGREFVQHTHSISRDL